MYCMVIRTGRVGSNGVGGSGRIIRGWAGANWFDMAVEKCGKVESPKT